jgi:cell division protein FtsW
MKQQPNALKRWMQALNARIARSWGAQPEPGLDALPVRVHGTEFARTGASPVHVKGFDQPLVWVTFALLMIGLVMVYSASIPCPTTPVQAATTPPPIS